MQTSQNTEPEQLKEAKEYAHALKGATNADDFAKIIAALTKQRRLAAAASSPEFRDALRWFAKSHISAGSDRDRLLTLALFARVGNVARKARKEVGQIIASVLLEPPPPLGLLDSPNERLAVAGAWRIAPATWWAEYLATAAVREDNTAEKIRSECIQGLLSYGGNLERIFELLRNDFVQLRFETTNPNKSAASRFLSVVRTLRKYYGRNQIDLGTNIGAALTKFIDGSFKATGEPQDKVTKEKITEETALFVHEFVKARFSTATNPSTYAVMDTLRSWYRPLEWSELAENSLALNALLADIREALTLLVKAGVTDDALFRRLVQTSGSAQKGREIGRQIASDLPGLPVEIRHWLLGVSPKAESALATESQDRSLDELVAELLIDTRRLAESAEIAEGEVLPQLSIVAPPMADVLSRFIRQCRVALQSLQYVAQKRGLKVRGSVGEELDISPLEHELVDGPRPGVRRVRILRPAVEAVTTDGQSRIVRKALVEPVAGQGTQSVV